MIDLSGVINTIAGISGTLGYNGDDIPADTALLYNPIGIPVDTCGSVFICDHQNARIRKITFDSCVTPLGIANKDFKPRISIFPNPATDFTRIQSPLIIKEIQIFDVTGRLVTSYRSEMEKIDINVSSFPFGMYIVKLDGIVAGKFLKLD